MAAAQILTAADMQARGGRRKARLVTNIRRAPINLTNPVSPGVQDLVRFGNSTREYVLLKEKSACVAHERGL